MNPSLAELITFGLAVLGAALGVINTIHGLRHDSVRLHVQANRWFDTRGGEGWSVDVINRSAFPVTIDYLCIPAGKSRVYVHQEMLHDLPKCLSARTAASFRITTGATQTEGVPARGRFRVRTACGLTRHSPCVRFHD